ncbi:MAG: hypothetical protein AAF067_07080 [Pseudomonadota bacterium]
MVTAASQGSSRKSVAISRKDSKIQSSRSFRWDKKMSNHCAGALLFYTMMQIFFVLSFIETKGMSIAPYFGLVLLVAIIIPFCRGYEKRWEGLANSSIPETNMALRFRRDVITLWLLAMGLPIIFVGVIQLFAYMF